MLLKLNSGKCKSYQDTIRNFLQELLEKKTVDAVLVPLRNPVTGNVAQALVTDERGLNEADPLAPLQMVNAAKILVELTREESGRKIAAVLRPCEARATIELIKLKQVLGDNLVMIGYDCPGAYDAKAYFEMTEKEGPGADIAGRCLKEFTNGDARSLRPACALCAKFTGESADLNLAWIGVEVPEVGLETNSEKGLKLAEGLQAGEVKENPGRTKIIAKISGQRREKEQDPGENIRALIGKCLRCYNCREVCPLCYCKECLLKPEKMGYTSERHLKRAIKKGRIKMPADTLLYHLTKMNHMAVSCVACGLCEQACPVGLPLGKIYRKMGKDIQALFGYIPGMSVNDELPFVTFKEDELPDVEDVKK